MFITDLDGTLFRPDQTLSQTDLDTLKELGDKGIVRVAATGRSIFSLVRALKTDLPIDYLVFSTGAGIARWPDPFNRILRSKTIGPDETVKAVDLLEEIGVDYMIQDPIPDNHCFRYRSRSGTNSDFATRIEYYREFCSPLNGNNRQPSSQILAIVPEGKGESVLKVIREKLTGYSVIKATSPFDGKTVWIEVFPEKTSKSEAVAWLADQLGIARSETAAVGNDYNDEDLLHWVGKGFVVENAPSDLCEKFRIVSANTENGFTEAVRLSI